MTVAAPGKAEGFLEKVTNEQSREDGEVEVALFGAFGTLTSNLQIGADLGSAMPLASNGKVAGMGVALHGSGFILDPEAAEAIRSQGTGVVVPFVSGADLMKDCRERYLIDFSFLSEEQARIADSTAYQHVLNNVKPERDQNRREVLKRLWWRFGWERPVLREAIEGLSRYIGTPETAKHRVFQFISSAILPEHRILAVASSDAFDLAVLKQIHDDLDQSVLEAYGWADCSGDQRSPRRDGSGEEDSRRQ